MKLIKLTKQRQIILDILKEAKTPLTAKDIYTEAIKKLPSLAQTTIYRNIDSLFEIAMISRYRIDKEQYSYKLNDEKHTHYLLCKECGKLTDLPICPISHFKGIAELEDFEITNHSIEILGYCKKCKIKKKE